VLLFLRYLWSSLNTHAFLTARLATVHQIISLSNVEQAVFSRVCRAPAAGALLAAVTGDVMARRLISTTRPKCTPALINPNLCLTDTHG
jgi:hypothetical protein